MVSDDNNYAILYNGEVYNFPEIRKELESLGHTFKSSRIQKLYLRLSKNLGKIV